jgi:hypothetical protein
MYKAKLHQQNIYNLCNEHGKGKKCTTVRDVRSCSLVDVY